MPTLNNAWHGCNGSWSLQHQLQKSNESMPTRRPRRRRRSKCCMARLRLQHKKTLEANSNDASKLTVKEMDAIAYTYFMNAVLKGKKPEKVRGLQTLIRTHSDVMPRALAAITDNAAGSDEYDDLPLSRQHSNMHWMQSPQMIQMMTCPCASLQPLLHCNVQIKTLMQRSSQPAVTTLTSSLTRITTKSRA